MRMRKQILAVILILCCLLPLSFANAGFEDPSTLTVVLEYDNEPLPGIRIAICRVADVRENNGSINFDTVAAFVGAGADFSNLGTAERNLAQAAILDAYAAAHNIGRSVATTNSAGGATFENLPAGLYLVAQDDAENSEYSMAPYLVMVPNMDADTRVTDNNVVSHPKTGPTKRDGETISVSVYKLWIGGCNHPSSVQVQLYRNGTPHGSPVTLNAGNYWSHTWDNLDPDDTWTVDEPNVPAGYTKTVSGCARNGFIITNAKNPDGTPGPTCAPTCTPGPTATPKPGKPGGSPKTDDKNKIPLWVTLAVASLLGLLALLWVLIPKRCVFAISDKGGTNI